MNAEWVLASFVSGKYAEAISKYEMFAAAHPEDVTGELRNTVGICFMRLGRCLEAKAVFEEILKEFPEDGEARANLSAAVFAAKRVELDRGDNFFQTGQYDQALQAYLSVELNDTDAGDRELKFQLSNNKGACMMQLGQVREALAQFEFALTLKPDHIEALHNKGTVLKALDQYELSLAAYDQCLSLSPDFYPALCGKSEVLSSLGRYEDGVEAATRAIAVKDTEARAYADRGYAYLKSVRYFEAASDLQKANARGETSAETHKLLCLALSMCGDEHSRASNYSDALTCYEQALSFGPADEPNPNLLFNHALALLHSGRKQDAISEFQHVKDINPQHFSACAALGLLHLQDGKCQEALLNLEAANEIKPDDKDVLYNLGVAALQLQLYEKASLKFRELLRLDSNHGPAQKALGVVEAHLSFVAAQISGLTAVPQSKPEPPPRAEPQGTATGGQSDSSIPSFEDLSPRVRAARSKRLSTTERIFVQMTFSYEQLKAPGPWPKGVNHLHRENYLSDSEFETVFGMPREEFNGLAQWKKTAKKKELELF